MSQDDDDLSHDEDRENDDLRPAQELEEEELFARLKRWFKIDRDHSDEWRSQAKEDYAFVAGDQWDAKDMAALREKNRPVIVFNRVEPVVSAVSGTEIGNRQEVKYLPRTLDDAAINEQYTAAAKWFRENCDAEDEESDAFVDALICGMGWTETRLDYDIDEDGAPIIERLDPLEMFWDATARKRNLEDARRVWRVRDMSASEALSLIPEADFDDLGAPWAVGADSSNPTETRQEARFYRPTSKDDGQPIEGTVTVIECQWFEIERGFLVPSPADPSKTETLSEDEFETFSARAKAIGLDIKAAPTARRVYRRAYLGKKILRVEPSPFGNHFNVKAITGKRDRNKGTWYGIVRSMKDPQRWANKWLSQTMHIMNTTAKGGVMAEMGVADDTREFQKTWAQADEVTWLANGTLSSPNGPKVVPKPQPVLPTGYVNLMEFAVSAIRDTSGVNLELLGLKEQEQAGVLEAQRKKQAMAVLAVMFDSLRRYRKSQGRLLLFIIQNYLADGRLIRILGDEGQKYVPLMRDATTTTYDVIVDDAPTSTDQKAVTWAAFMQLLPVMKDAVTPEMWGAVLPYSPFPDSVVQKIKEIQAKPDPDREEQKQLAKAGQVAKVRETESKAALNEAKAAEHGVNNMLKVSMPPMPPQPALQ